ncbi:hypothetical protein TREMEDRAFT_63595 [Tremella mesenterica DSM 1558]|uniref:uncharacterized protein n=1 Tax=Tremella mesenterica (strain ATCC 24925 / CBS 8224 / DSM 1558 / NBRC 9311 / NRRL Y-6157 / RJB 2259-6 / UBC 559-6) TaxID=578456 RepID=UPI0003F49083|nr:uncharacterized protein TREMEDRAFT_63595 [Tremella mesenterica DSM 1558]EIW68428.1 hypothetical protein TREMEDRAFT_63595 [Tremella mesenterica DSM 1558]
MWHCHKPLCATKNTSSTAVDNFATRPEFQVKHERVLQNLLALQRFHPDYISVEIDHQTLASLPENGSVFHQLRSTVLEDSNTSNDSDQGPILDEDNVEAGLVTEGVIPNVGGGVHVITETRNVLQNIVQQDIVLSAPIIRSTLVNEQASQSLS